MFAVVDSRQDGLEFLGDWDNLGQRLTESGGVVIRDVEVPWRDALGFVNKRYQPSVYATLNVPAIQLVFTSFYLGIAEGALAAALEYNRRNTRPWPYGGDNKARAADEFYVLDGFGDLQSRLWASQALVEQTVAVVDELLHRPRETVTARERGEAAVKVAAAKQRIVETGLDIATRLYELTGARASANKYGFDIYWRNLRTHSLHDPIAYKRVEVGRFALLGEIPEPTWYT
ncbi:FMNH2-dependent monooxygenase [Salinisphaera sp. S4-8]